jgi:NADPH:quinone reductase-like Zn-dependent oxidoreductase
MDMGAERCFDYRDPDIVQQIRAAAGEQGIFAAYDTPASNKSTESCIGKTSICRISLWT